MLRDMLHTGHFLVGSPSMLMRDPHISLHKPAAEFCRLQVSMEYDFSLKSEELVRHALVILPTCISARPEVHDAYRY
jgi:hypothetical protein